MPTHAKTTKARWKFSFGRSSPAPSTPSSPAPSVLEAVAPPASFLCPVSSSLMSDPVITPSGNTFERACIEACRELNFSPPSLLTSSSALDLPSFFLIPNAALRSAISDWCDRAGLPRPSPLSPDSTRALVHELMSKEKEEQKSHFSPPPSNSSSSSSYPSTSSFSTSDDINLTTSSSASDNISPAITTAAATAADPLEESILSQLKSPQVAAKESGLVALRHSARDSADSRVSLCTPRILAAVVPLVNHASSTIQANATAALVNLSIEPSNKVKIVRAGAIPPLVQALSNAKSSSHCEEARCNAAGALFSLALEDENKLAIGVLGGVPPLVSLFCQESVGLIARAEAGMALYHLSLAPNNLSKIAKTPGAVKAILNIAVAASTTTSAEGESETSEETTARVLSLRRLQRIGMMVLASLARRDDGRVALMDAGAVKAMVELITAGREDEYCLAVMYEMSKGKGSLRFRALARAAGAEKALLAHHDGRGEVGREMVRRTIKVMRGGDHEAKGVDLLKMLGDEIEEEELEEVGSVVSDGLVSFRRRRFDDLGGSSANNSANF